MKRLFFVFVAIIIFLAMLIGEYAEDPEYPDAQQAYICNEYTNLDSVSFNITQFRAWRDYYGNDEFCGSYYVAVTDAHDAGRYRDNMEINYYLHDTEFWGAIYRQLYESNKDHLMGIQDSLLRISTDRQFDRAALARTAVAMIQDMPYEFVMPDNCEGRTSAPCNPGVKFGIYSPLEFLYTMKGDCDTRTVLLFTLLKNLGYDPLIINSTQYGHSMLALDVPSSGDDFEYRGRRYAYWETTNVGWLPGMLPPDMNNESYWDIALAYE
jgi:hypothetical protein